MSEAQPGVVYFIQQGHDGPIKIGKTLPPVATRLAALQVGNPAPLRVLVTLPGYSELESRMHRRFAALRIRSSEWFEPGDMLRAFIERALAGLPDPVERDRARVLASLRVDLDSVYESFAAERSAALITEAERFLASAPCPT